MNANQVKPMNPLQLQLVHKTFTQVTPLAESASTLFYQRLFQIDPSLQPVFPQSSAGSQRWLQFIESAVKTVERGQSDYPFRSEVETEHCDAVGAALILALQQGLGPSFTGEARKAWLALFDHLAITTKNTAPASPSALGRAA